MVVSEWQRGVQPGTSGSFPSSLTNVEGTLYFGATDGTVGNELWKSNGTSSRTSLDKDIQPATGGSNPRYLMKLGGTLVFTANDGITGDEL